MNVRRVLRLLQPAMVLVALVFVVALMAAQWQELRAYPWTLRPGWLLASALLLVASWAMEIGIWRYLLHAVGAALPFAPAVRIWFLSAVVRYIPGNIWQPLSMTLQARRWGVPAEATLTGVALYQAVILLAVAPLTAIYLLLTGNLGLFTDFLAAWTPWIIGLATLPALVFLARPQWLIDIINWALVKLGRVPLAAELTSLRLLGLLTVAALNWLVWGASFAALAFALSDDTAAEMLRLLPHLLFSYPIAYAIGFLSFITPSGFGVREGAFYVLLAPIMTGGVATAIALAMRLWTTLGEVLMAGLAAWLVPPAPRDALPTDAMPTEDIAPETL